jgi:hypothetical protein
MLPTQATSKGTKCTLPTPRLLCRHPRAPCSTGTTAFCCNPSEMRCCFSNEPDRRKLRNHSNNASDAMIAMQCIRDRPHLRACSPAGAPDHIPTSPCRHPECTQRAEPHPSQEQVQWLHAAAHCFADLVAIAIIDSCVFAYVALAHPLPRTVPTMRKAAKPFMMPGTKPTCTSLFITMIPVCL